MRLVFEQTNIDKKLLIAGGLIIVLATIGLANELYNFSQTIENIDWSLWLGRLPATILEKEGQNNPATSTENLVFEQEQSETLPTGNVYEETAQSGDGITHLARRALKRYLEEREPSVELSPEHKIYIEDYIQNRIGDQWISLGEKLTISEDLVVEGINQALLLTPGQLNGLSQYSVLVSAL